MKLDELVAGTIDLHCHVYPEMTLEHEARQDDVDLIDGAVRARMGGVPTSRRLALEDRHRLPRWRACAERRRPAVVPACVLPPHAI